MIQGNLFGGNAYGEAVPLVTRAARNDPVTSHESAAKVAKSAKAALHRQIVLTLVKAHPSSTGFEIWQSCTANQQAELETPNEIWRKLNDLKHAGLVEQGEARVCIFRGRRMVTWSPTPPG